MRPLLRKNHLLALRVGLRARESSSSCCGHHRQGPGEESRNVKVSVWWDFENCNVPAGTEALDVAPAITRALRANGIKGPLRISAFGDVLLFSKATQQALAHTGIHFTHIPGKNSADRFLLVDLMDWVSRNPPPAHLFLISGDGDFAGILHRLRMNNYNILLASPRQAPDVLCSAATIIWQWSSLVKGEYLSGKHFNHPPDGLLGSWYGNYEVTLQKPFSAVEQSTSSQKVDIYEPALDLHTVPKAVVRQIWRILRSHPKGISIGDLRLELMKHNVPFVKNFYGYKTFARFLSSTPYVELKPLGDGNFHVYLVPSEPPKPFEGNAVESVTSAIKIDERGSAATPKLNDEDKNKAREANETPLTASFHKRSMNDDSKSFQPVTSLVKPMGEYVDAKSSLSLVERRVPQASNELQKSSLCNGEVVDMTIAQLSKIQPQLKDNQVSKTKPDSLKMSSKNSSDDDIIGSEDASHKIQEKYMTSRNHSAGNDQIAVEDIGSAKSGDSIAHQNNLVSHFEDSNSSELDQTVQTVNDFEEPKLSELNQNVICSGKPESFSSGSFWNDMESFIFTLKGSFIVSQSKNREDMAHKLHKDGPLVLRSLTEKDILQLVELLISEKKWLEESPSQTFPFRLTQPIQKNSLMGQSCGANGLRSLFLSRASQSKLQKSSEHDVEKHNQSIPHTRVSATATETKYTERSRNDILEDCQKLVSEILREHPEGYSISSFPRLFVDRCGYHLDLQKLGYHKLGSLLQIMPGLKVESTYIFPSVPAVSASVGETFNLKTQVTNACNAHVVLNSDSELSDSAPQDDNMDSPWEELGHVSVNNSNQSNLESK
ncbi:Meiosis arrest female protein 1-like [Spatholobus suberectus]|nr:Meiosis arrest female protein 1-like [Spatholobus suberectus]